MKNEIEIKIPAEIAALAISLQEKVDLAHIHSHFPPFLTVIGLREVFDGFRIN